MVNVFNTFERHATKLLGELPSRARTILKQRYGIGLASTLTLEAIGKKEGITRERVRQIENDARRRIKKSPVFAEGALYASALIDMVVRLGGVVSESELLEHADLASVKDKKVLVLFLDLTDGISKRKADENFDLRWHTDDAPVEKIEGALVAFTKGLDGSNEVLKENELHTNLAVCLRDAGVSDVRAAVLSTYVGLTKSIEKNILNEYGHINSPFVRPRGMRESAFVALSRSGEPLHFRKIAERINDFTNRSVHVQTVHNELIKDKRFVLVGRGLYALRDWGYEPGFVKDVLVRLIKDKGAMTRENILSEVSQIRQVKPSTVFINLQNKKIFKSLDDGTYTLVS
ncbi:MAG: sigma factor-like helix-turn-helix DNA-binding protein [bacterium]|nr:sigma factor-like helix-turn-helix DNA-binding protein [bacterium]